MTHWAGTLELISANLSKQTSIGTLQPLENVFTLTLVTWLELKRCLTYFQELKHCHLYRFLHFTVIQLNVEAHCFLITVIMFIHIRGVFRTKSDIQRGVLCGYNKLFTFDVSPASKDISEACSSRVIFIRIGQILVATCKNDAVCRIRLFLSARFIKLNTSNYCRRGFCGTETLSCLILGCGV